MAVHRYRRGRWRVILWHKGRRKDWIVSGTKQDAEAVEARERVKLEAGDPTAYRTAPTFCDFCASRYRPHAETELKCSTWRNRVYLIATLVEHFGFLKLTEITTEHVERFKQARVRQVKPVSVNNELAVLQAVLTYARRLGVPHAKPAIQFLPVRAAHRVGAWTAEEIERLYKAAAEVCPDVLPLIVFLANTGCRKGEALALPSEHVDLERRIVRIWPSEEWQPKSGRSREVPICDALLPWLDGERRSARWVFPNRKGEQYAYWPKRQFDAARRKAGLVGGPHTLRHSFASHFLASTPDVFLLARILGHSDVRVTRLYAHLLPDHLARAREAVSLASPVGPAALAAAKRWRVATAGAGS